MSSSRGKAVAIKRSGALSRVDFPVVVDWLAALRFDPGLLKWLSGIASLVVFGLVLYAVRNVDWTMLGLALSAGGFFWLVFLANYLHAPFADAIILGRVWGNPVGLFATLVRKQIVNAVALPYAGDGLVIAWAHARGIWGFGAVKDAAILSGIAGSVVTFIIILPVWEPLSKALGLSPSALFTSLGLLSAFPLIAIFRRSDVFTLADLELCRIAAVHAARFIANITLVALCWHLLLPAEAFQSWLMLAAARMVVSRLPLLPNKEIALAAVAVSMFPERPEVAAIVAVTGLLLTLAHLLVWVGLAARNDKGAAARVIPA